MSIFEALSAVRVACQLLASVSQLSKNDKSKMLKMLKYYHHLSLKLNFKENVRLPSMGLQEYYEKEQNG